MIALAVGFISGLILAGIFLWPMIRNAVRDLAAFVRNERSR